MIPGLDPTSAISSSALSGNHLIVGSDEALNNLDHVVSQEGNGSKFIFQLPSEVSSAAPQGDSSDTNTVNALGSSHATNFGHLAQQMVRDVNNYQQVAGDKVRDVLMGGPTSVHEAMIAVQESTVAFQLLAQVRNKLIDSYQELNRMQI